MHTSATDITGTLFSTMSITEIEYIFWLEQCGEGA